MVCAVLGIGAAALAGCNLWQQQRLVQLPELPPAWRHYEVAMLLTVVDGRDGRPRQLPAARPGDRLALPLGRYAASVIVAQPLVVGRAPAADGSAPAVAGPATGRLLRPAGAVVPVSDARSGVLEVTWERGLLASLLLDLWRGGANPWLLNLERLDRELTARGAGDPWTLNRVAILAALEANAMSLAAIRPLPVRRVDPSTTRRALGVVEPVCTSAAERRPRHAGSSRAHRLSPAARRRWAGAGAAGGRPRSRADLRGGPGARPVTCARPGAAPRGVGWNRHRAGA